MNYSGTLKVHIDHDMPNAVSIGGDDGDEGHMDDYQDSGAD